MNTKRNYLLLTPGPLSTSETVREAMLQDWCTWDKDYNEGIVTPIRKGLLAIAGLDEDEYTDVLLQGSGTYCVEATIGAAVKPTDKLLILANGAYGKRMAQIAEYYHIDHVLVSLHETELVTGEVARKALEANPDITHLSMVHSETTTGLLNPIEEVAEVLKGRNITFIVDAMSSFGGVPIDMKKLDIDFLVSSANKCIQGVPGFGFIIAKKDKLIATKGNARSLSLDIYAQWETMEKGGGKWRFTSPTHVVHAFYQAMKELNEEGGIVARSERYKQNHRTLVDGMRALGFKTLLPDASQGPIITSFLYPIQGVPGFGFIIAKKDKLIATKGNARSLSLDIYAQWETMEKGGGKWRFTSPTHVVHAFYQAMKELNEEGGIVARSERYKQNHRTLVDGMRALGFKTLLPDASQGPIITSFLYPTADFDFHSFYDQLKAKGFVIYPGKISDADTFRIGNIGDIFPDDMEALLQAIRSISY